MIPDTANAGAENQARYLVEALSRHAGWAVEIVYFRRGAAHADFVSLGLPMRQLRSPIPAPFDLGHRALALRCAYQRRPPAILHTWLFEANFVGALAASGWPATGLVATQRSGNLERETPRALRWSRLIRARADEVIANSADGMALLSELGFDRSRTSLIRNGFPPAITHCQSAADERRLARERLGLDDATPVVGYVGRVDAAKDLGTMFGAMSRVWDTADTAKLFLLGPSEQELDPYPIARRDSVQALGWVPRPWELMSAFDVLVSSSWTEGHSNSVCEALLAGVPVACTSTGDHVQLVERTGGVVVPIRSPLELGAGILQLLSTRPSRQDVSRVARECLAMEPVVDATLESYARARDHRASRGRRRI